MSLIPKKEKIDPNEEKVDEREAATASLIPKKEKIDPNEEKVDEREAATGSLIPKKEKIDPEEEKVDERGAATGSLIPKKEKIDPEEEKVDEREAATGSLIPKKENIDPEEKKVDEPGPATARNRKRALSLPLPDRKPGKKFPAAQSRHAKGDNDKNKKDLFNWNRTFPRIFEVDPKTGTPKRAASTILAREVARSKLEVKKCARVAAQPYSIPNPRLKVKSFAARGAGQLVPASDTGLAKTSPLNTPSTAKSGARGTRAIFPASDTWYVPPSKPGHSESSKCARVVPQPYSIPNPRLKVKSSAARGAGQLVPASDTGLANSSPLDSKPSTSKPVALRGTAQLVPASDTALYAHLPHKQPPLQMGLANSSPLDSKPSTSKPVALRGTAQLVPASDTGLADSFPRTVGLRGTGQLVPASNTGDEPPDARLALNNRESRRAVPISDNASPPTASEMTEYFLSLSPMLVRGRINRAKFYWLQHQINRFVLGLVYSKRPPFES